jgi:hypothetical protein
MSKGKIEKFIDCLDYSIDVSVPGGVFLGLLSTFIIQCIISQLDSRDTSFKLSMITFGVLTGYYLWCLWRYDFCVGKFAKKYCNKVVQGFFLLPCA